MQYYIPLYIIIFLFGIVIGSFLNVCIYRLPLKENIATTGSHCMSCGHGLRWYDLVPLFSWLQLRGRCRYCKARISVQYPLIEAMNGIGYVLIFVVNGICVDSILMCLFFSCLVTLSVIDWRTYEIPVGINITILVLGVFRCALDYHNIVLHLIGLVCVSVFLLLLNLVTGGRAMGGGGGTIPGMEADYPWLLAWLYRRLDNSPVPYEVCGKRQKACIRTIPLDRNGNRNACRRHHDYLVSLTILRELLNVENFLT